jgi:hypothetical protein
VRLSRLLAGGVAIALLTGTVSCGLPAVEPKLQLRDAARAFTEGSAGTVRLSVASSADDLRAFAEAAVGDPSSAADVTDDVLETLVTTSLDIGYDVGVDGETTDDDSSSVVVRIGDLAAAELRSVGTTAYARADVDGLVEQFPDLQGPLDELREALAAGGGAADPVPAAAVDPVTAFLESRWVALDVPAYLEQLSTAGVGTASEESTARLRALLGDALEDAAGPVERRGTDADLGDHLVARFDLRTAWSTLRDGLPEAVPELGTAGGTDELLPPVADVPDIDVEVSFWALGGRLTRIELDVAQFLDEPVGHLVLRADVLPAERITAPTGAVPVDLAAIQSELAARAAAETGYYAQLEPDAHMIATWVDQDLANLAYELHTVPTARMLPQVLPLYEPVGERVPGLAIAAVGNRVQVTVAQEVVCLRPSQYGNAEDIEPGPC